MSAHGGPLLVGDIGGTNIRLAVAERDGAGAITLRSLLKRPADEFSCFEDAVAAFLGTADAPARAACFALAGPVDIEPVTLTNRDWVVSREALRARFDLEQVAFVNDFAALARGAVETPASGFERLKPGEAAPDAPVVIGGPGTGFGMAIAARFEGAWRILPGEGGHQSFAPQSAFEWAVAEALREKTSHVSTEMIAAGLHAETVRRAVYDVLGEAYAPLHPADIRAAAEAGDGAARAYCQLRADAVMASLGDAALLAGARGGAIIAGGVATALKSFLASASSVARFASHGPMSDYLAAIPVDLLVDQDAPLVGAARLFSLSQTR